MNTWTLKKKLVATFATVLALAGLLIAIALTNTNRLLETVRWNTHTYEVLSEADKLLLSMVNIETGLRGFVASGNDRFLEPFNKGKQDFSEHFEKVKSLTADNAAQQKRLDLLMSHHKAFLEVAQGLAGKRRDTNAGRMTAEALLKEFEQGKDKAAMDAFRAGIAEFSQAESALLGERSQALEDTGASTTRTLILGGLALCAVSAVLGTLLTRSLFKQLGAEPSLAVAVAERVARGDLSEAPTLAAGDTTSLMANLARMQTSLAQVVSNVRSNSESVATASAQIAQGNQDLSARTEQQASALQQTAATMEQLGTTVRHNADSAQQANQLALGASSVAKQGGQVVGEVVSTMQGISESSRKIGDIIGVIDGIAFQTNILALNAAVEAARAGEQGRGFAVVASEVRSLAQRSAQAAKEIKTLIGSSVEQVEKGTQLVDQAGKTMDDIVSSIQRVSDIVAEITAASAEQSSGVQQVGEAVTSMDQATQQNAALVEESAAAAESLRSQARQLVEAVAVFTLSREGHAAKQALATSASAAADASMLAARKSSSTRPVPTRSSSSVSASRTTSPSSVQSAKPSAAGSKQPANKPVAGPVTAPKPALAMAESGDGDWASF
ncbi:methyl-accepting chemotaxis protein [Roseateles depolymerans]|uniref:Chemotaxis protein n=1 Tax=Roseateles depolymerans TaxID=76731 RepID=A0A0U3N6P3_9BURK|nr:methyl-accepting chemotaxis protein [Roseateles depolymerans]ALV07867.1 Chemotaxis protein [Roseateles depolymerans]REG21912.1 methyl-accepting chemotaxis protein [Roseateles depolymerans]